MRAVICGLLCLFSLSSQAVFITASNGRTYDVEEVGGSFEGIAEWPLTRLFPWWGDPGLAFELAAPIAEAFGYGIIVNAEPWEHPDLCETDLCGPIVVYDGNPRPPFFIEGTLAMITHQRDFGTFSFVDDSVTNYRFAIATVVPSPGAPSLMLLGFILAGMSYRLSTHLTAGERDTAHLST